MYTFKELNIFAHFMTMLQLMFIFVGVKCEVRMDELRFVLDVHRGYFPIQKLEKISPNKSSELNSPVMEFR